MTTLQKLDGNVEKTVRGKLRTGKPIIDVPVHQYEKRPVETQAKAAGVRAAQLAFLRGGRDDLPRPRQPRQLVCLESAAFSLRRLCWTVGPRSHRSEVPENKNDD